MSEIWRFTGPPENWITGIGLRRWALNEHNKTLWERDIRPGDGALFHSTRKSGFSNRAISTIIGFGYIGEGLSIKREHWWVQEVTEHNNFWPYVVPLKEIYLFSDISGIDFATPIEKKPPRQVETEILRLIENGLMIEDLNRQAKFIDPRCTEFPVNGSASRINPIFEDLILKRNEDLFVAHDAQETKQLDEALSESLDDKLSQLDNPTILAQARAFDNSQEQSHFWANGPRKVRRENQLQKRRIAKLENYTCQVCGFRYEYIRRNGKPAWIIHVDHVKDKAAQGMENIDNLWVLCPNCHSKKTCGSLKIDLGTKTVTERGSKINLFQDNHLFI